jgi:hypothetical protein
MPDFRPPDSLPIDILFDGARMSVGLTMVHRTISVYHVERPSTPTTTGVCSTGFPRRRRDLQLDCLKDERSATDR